MKTTNKQLIKQGVTQEQILELTESVLVESFTSRNLISTPEWGGDDEYTEIQFEDHKGRTWSVYFIDGEELETLFINSYKGENAEEVNEKSFKSIHAVVNYIERVL